ncbi:hypothetical protein Q3G72_002482 [Acer saccharum]|nr:hypothetical protein Q3G72_002482 [Acer saccharum]
MFVSGTMKYLERTRALYLASLDRFRDSMLKEPDPGPNYAKLMDEYVSKKEAKLPAKIITIEEPVQSSVKSEASGPTENNLEVVTQAHCYFKIFKGLIVDLIFSFHERDESWEFFGKLRQEGALRVIEVELNFIYEVFYTKIQGRNRPGYRVAFFMLIFSDWTFAALRISSNDSKLLRKIKSSVASVLSWFLIFKKPRWYQSQNQEVLATPFLFRRWCGYVSGHNLVRYCLKGRPTRIHKVHNRFQCAVQETIQYLKIDKFIKTLGFAIAKISQFFCINEVICFLGFIREIH